MNPPSGKLVSQAVEMTVRAARVLEVREEGVVEPQGFFPRLAAAPAAHDQVVPVALDARLVLGHIVSLAKRCQVLVPAFERTAGGMNANADPVA